MLLFVKYVLRFDAIHATTVWWSDSVRSRVGGRQRRDAIDQTDAAVDSWAPAAGDSSSASTSPRPYCHRHRYRCAHFLPSLAPVCPPQIHISCQDSSENIV
ncbi:hypothetical protein J6590_008070 [Homalodisca vitripennis]|nr:hypothetical protein J6590_008070 [Homalodisca vitripennis]